MSIIAFEGFEGLDPANTGADNQQALLEKGSVSASDNLTQTTARYAGGTAVYGPASALAGDFVRYQTPAGITELIMGFAFRRRSAVGVDPLNAYVQGTSFYDFLSINQTTFEIEAPKGTGTGIFLQEGLDVYIEARCKIDNGAGEVELRLNGQQRSLQTGLSINPGTVNFTGIVGVARHIVDDFYLIDTTDGVGKTSFLGPVRIENIALDGDGDTTQWTPDSANNYEDVDDLLPADGDTTKVTATAVGQEDQYTLGNISATPDAIFAISIYGRHRTDAGVATVNTYLSDGTNVSTGSAGTILSSYSSIGDIYESAADGSAWTFNNLASAQAGQKWSA